jgi:putative ABC transport system permease protein
MVVQVSISLILIIACSGIFSQIDFLKNINTGFDKKDIISIPLGISNQNNNEIYESLKNRLAIYPDVKSITASWNHPLNFKSPPADVMFKGEKLDATGPISVSAINYDFIETFNIQLKNGRSITKEFGAQKNGVVINESLEKLLNDDNPIGQKLQISETFTGEIVGVVKDFILESPEQAAIQPLIMFYHPEVNYVFVKLHSKNFSKTIDQIKTIWTEINPNFPFEYEIFENEFGNLFNDTENLSRVLLYFTILAVIIACLGLVGLASFSAQKRTKEIGLRKVLGSKIYQLVGLLGKDFLKLALFANIVAWPISWILLQMWLQNFPNRTLISWEYFIKGSVLVLVLIILSVSYQSIKVAITNPVNTLRDE